jgi:hypothetical protein
MGKAPSEAGGENIILNFNFSSLEENYYSISRSTLNNTCNSLTLSALF